jgi:dihydroxyacetone kinase-like protein
MKKLINTPDHLVEEELAGMAAAHADLIRIEAPNVVVRKDAPRQGKVGVISGGGSGHEPMHGGFVGMGMLDAACPGAVFTSPVPDQMLAATKAVDGGKGVLHIVKNYTGDIMNFEIAAEMAQADGIDVASVVIADDVAVQDSLYTAGRRGVGGTVLAEKIVGAAAEEGQDLAAVKALCERVQANVRSMGMALTSCTVPAAGKPTFEIGDDEMEIGIGIHGEPGRQGPRLRQRHGRHAAHRALRDLQQGRADLRRTRHHDCAQPGRQLHHVARDGRLLHHDPAPRRRDDQALGCTGSHAGPEVGGVMDR